MKVTIYDNYHAGVSMLPREEQDAFYGALVRYAFDGEEPEFEGISAAIWATIQTLIDKSITGQQNGAKGGNGRGNTKSEKDSGDTTKKTSKKTTSKNPSEKPPEKRVCENQIKEIEGNGKENPKDFFSNSCKASDGAAVAEATPPSAFQCPTCGMEMERTNSHRGDKVLHRCKLCAEEVWA